MGNSRGIKVVVRNAYKNKYGNEANLVFEDSGLYVESVTPTDSPRRILAHIFEGRFYVNFDRVSETEYEAFLKKMDGMEWK